MKYLESESTNRLFLPIEFWMSTDKDEKEILERLKKVSLDLTYFDKKDNLINFVKQIRKEVPYFKKKYPNLANFVRFIEQILDIERRKMEEESDKDEIEPLPTNLVKVEDKNLFNNKLLDIYKKQNQKEDKKEEKKDEKKESFEDRKRKSEEALKNIAKSKK